MKWIPNANSEDFECNKSKLAYIGESSLLFRSSKDNCYLND